MHTDEPSGPGGLLRCTRLGGNRCRGTVHLCVSVVESCFCLIVVEALGHDLDVAGYHPSPGPNKRFDVKHPEASAACVGRACPDPCPEARGDPRYYRG